jgi:hypothetical protein
VAVSSASRIEAKWRESDALLVSIQREKLARIDLGMKLKRAVVELEET